MFKIRRLFLGKGKKKGKDYLWTKCPQEKKEKTGRNDKIIHENVSAMVRILKRNFFE